MGSAHGSSHTQPAPEEDDEVGGYVLDEQSAVMTATAEEPQFVEGKETVPGALEIGDVVEEEVIEVAEHEPYANDLPVSRPLSNEFGLAPEAPVSPRSPNSGPYHTAINTARPASVGLSNGNKNAATLEAAEAEASGDVTIAGEEPCSPEGHIVNLEEEDDEFESVSLAPGAEPPKRYQRPAKLNLAESNGSTSGISLKNKGKAKADPQSATSSPQQTENRSTEEIQSHAKAASTSRSIVTSSLSASSLASTSKTSLPPSNHENNGDQAANGHHPEGEGPQRAEQQQPTHARSPSQSTGPKRSSAPSHRPTPLQKVLSKTRPKYLPPKDPEEDHRHLKMHEELMKKGKEIDAKRASILYERRISRENMLLHSAAIWEAEILPNWKAVLRPDQHSATLRDLWWQGTMPPKHRGRLWSLAIGNGLAVGKASYQRSLSHAQSLISSGTYPKSVLESIEAAVSMTFPRLNVFQKDTGPMHQDLMNLLLAWSVFWKEKPTWADGVSFPAALLILNLSPPEAFLALVNLIAKSCLNAFYSRDKKEEVQAYYRIFTTLLADYMPKVYQNFLVNDINPSLYLGPWLRTCLGRYVSFDTATRIFDIYVLEGDGFLFRAALGILTTLEARLFNPDSTELERIFRGEDTGVRTILARNKGLDPSLIKENDPVLWPLDEIYEGMGVTNDALFEALETNSWDKDTFLRLVERELDF